MNELEALSKIKELAKKDVGWEDTNPEDLYETFELTEDRIGFYIIYPKDKEKEFKGRIRLIHSEEIKILKKYLTKEGVNFTRINKEINFTENLVSRYQKEQTRIAQENLIKFAGINEIVQNIEEYNWAEQQFEKLPSNRLLLRFFVPSVRIIVFCDLQDNNKPPAKIKRIIFFIVKVLSCLTIVINKHYLNIFSKNRSTNVCSEIR